MTASILAAWCPTCREMTVPRLDGRCAWCDTQTGGADSPTASAPAARHYIRIGEPGYGPVCACGGPKTRSSRRCRPCRSAAGHRGPDRDRMANRSRLSEAEVAEARRLYASGASLRRVAAALHPAAAERYASPASLANALRAVFRRRGWSLRPQGVASAAANAMRASGLSRRELRIRRGETLDRPLCAGVRTQYPRRGAPCRNRAMEGSAYCVSHDPARQAANAAVLERARARRAGARLREAA